MLIKKLKSFCLICSTIMLLAACSSSKEARTYKQNINGSWVLNSVTVEGISGKIKANILEEANYQCFENSAWQFNSNNSLGSYEIIKNSGDCVAKKQNIRWSVFEENGLPIRLQFKKVDATYYKDIDPLKSGYRFTIISLDKNLMKLKGEIVFENKPAFFIYNFSKN